MAASRKNSLLLAVIQGAIVYRAGMGGSTYLVSVIFDSVVKREGSGGGKALFVLVGCGEQMWRAGFWISGEFAQA